MVFETVITDALHIGFFGGKMLFDIDQQLLIDLIGRRDVVLLQPALDQIEQSNEFLMLGVQLGIADFHRVAPKNAHESAAPFKPQQRMQRKAILKETRRF